MLGRGGAQVIQNRRPVGDGPLAKPGPKTVAQGVHVRVTAHARVSKQVPGAAQAFATLQNAEAAARAIALQLHRRADARKAGTDDQYILVFHAPLD